jgi:hypothetical protein
VTNTTTQIFAVDTSKLRGHAVQLVSGAKISEPDGGLLEQELTSQGGIHSHG